MGQVFMSESSKKKYFIWGMGLLGASLAKDLLNLGHEVYGCVRSEKNKKLLIELGMKEVYTTDQESMWDQVMTADGIILGTPVEHIFGILENLHNRGLPKNPWITDMASTKGDLMRWVDNFSGTLNFVGSHPMAGSDLNGPEHAQDGLYNDATIYITPSDVQKEKIGEQNYLSTIEQVKAFWESTGANPFEVSYHVHDKWAAYLSHGLHLVSCMVSYLIYDIPEVLEMKTPPAAGSFRDITRVSGSNPELWDGIIGSNANEVNLYLQSLENLVKKWRLELANGTLPIREIFQKSGEIRKSIIEKTKDE